MHFIIGHSQERGTIPLFRFQYPPSSRFLVDYLATDRSKIDNLCMQKFCSQEEEADKKLMSTAEIIRILFEKIKDLVEECEAAKLNTNLLTIGNYA